MPLQLLSELKDKWKLFDLLFKVANKYHKENKYWVKADANSQAVDGPGFEAGLEPFPLPRVD